MPKAEKSPPLNQSVETPSESDIVDVFAYSSMRQDLDDNALLLQSPDGWTSSFVEPFEPVSDNAVTFDAPPGTVALVLSVLTFSSNSSVFVLLKEQDEATFTPCNVLCATNTYGVVFMVLYLVVYKKSLTSDHVRNLTRTDLTALLVGSILYQVVGPYFFYIALNTLSVPAASIVQRLESLYFLFLSYVFLRAEVSKWALFSASLTLVGVLLATFWNSLVGKEASYPAGILYMILSGFAYSGSLLTTKKYLSQCNTGIVAITRSVVGMVIFHLESIYMADSYVLLEAKAWGLTLPYGFVYVFMGQVAWTTALQLAEPVHLSVGTSALFPLTLAWSAVLISSVPDTSQGLAAAFIVAGIASSVAEVMFKEAKKKNDGDVSSRSRPESLRNGAAGILRKPLISIVLDEEENGHAQEKRGVVM